MASAAGVGQYLSALGFGGGGGGGGSSQTQSQTNLQKQTLFFEANVNPVITNSAVSGGRAGGISASTEGTQGIAPDGLLPEGSGLTSPDVTKWFLIGGAILLVWYFFIRGK